MQAISRRSFVAGSGAAVLGAASRGLAVAGTAGFGAAGLLACGSAWADAADGASASAIQPADLDASVAVGGAAFAYPSCWVVALDAPDEDSVRLDVLDRQSGAALGRMTFTAGSPAEAARSGWADAVFEGLAQSEAMATQDCLSAVWGLERIDRDGAEVPQARALCVRAWTSDARPSGAAGLEIGYLYMALAPDWTLVYAEALADLASFETVAALFDAVWQSATWPPAVTMETMDAANEAFAARALRRGAARNQVRPFYNKHWDLVDIDCPGGGYGGDGPLMPSNERYVFATPEGIQEVESSFEQAEISLGPGIPVRSLWSMRRTDGDGADYLRSTVEVEGYGVVDIAFYDNLNTFWYIADTGTPVVPASYPSDISAGWNVFAGWDGTPWKYIPAG